MDLSASTLLPVNGTLGVLLAGLLIGASAVVACYHLAPDTAGHRARRVLTAGLRAGLQLAAVSFAIAWVVHRPPATAAFLVLMLAVAVHTARRRITTVRRMWWTTAVPITAAVAPVVTALLSTGLLPFEGVALIPVTGILIGGAMTATVLAGRRALDELTHRHGEVEAAVALGFLTRDARLEIARPAAADALLPGLDQTRTVGLVTLPGAFVGMLLGGASPVMAGAVQLFVLVALMAVQAVSVALTVELVARGRLFRPARTGGDLP